MNEQGSSASFATGDYVHGTVSVNVHEQGIFNRWGSPHGNGRPGKPGLRGPGVQVGPRYTSLFPTGNEIGPTIAIDIPQLDPVRPTGDRIDDMTRPGLIRMAVDWHLGPAQ
jgi:hypothetical protein